MPWITVGTKTITAEIPGMHGTGAKPRVRPYLKILEPKDGAVYGKNNPFPGLKIEQSGIATISVYVDGKFVTHFIAVQKDIDVKINGLSQGAHTITVYGYDSNGNLLKSSTVSFSIFYPGVTPKTPTQPTTKKTKKTTTTTTTTTTTETSKPNLSLIILGGAVAVGLAIAMWRRR